MVTPLSYSLSSIPKINWTENQEKSLVNDYIFDQEYESDEQFVVKTYLQFLWLPESIMPLRFFVTSLLRIYSEPTEPHALHAYLKPLLQTARSASRKYNVELPPILANGGGSGEIEETMMWYALSYEKADEELWIRTSTISEGPWEDEQWRLKWLERMERREFQIQILLYFLKLSLPGPPPLPDPPSPPKKKKRKHSKDEKGDIEVPTAERLETFFDKLSMWQLMDGLERTKQSTDLAKKDTLDWMQTFFEDIVKPQFEQQLPDVCALMRSKIFPQPSISSSNPSSPSTSRASSPEGSRPKEDPFKRHIRRPSPTISVASSSRAKAQQLPISRDRSRSLSVSLAQERMERERSISLSTIGGVPKKKRVLNREVSMSRAFKPRARPATAQQESFAKRKAGESKETQGRQQQVKKDEGVLLVEATPVKSRMPPMRSRSVGLSLNADGNADRSYPRPRVESISFKPIRSSSSLLMQLQGDEGDDDEEWQLAGSASPDILLLGPETRVDDNGSGADDDGFLASPTPMKRTRIR